MSSATGIKEDSLLLEIEELLEKGQIKGRIDLIDKVSYSTFLGEKAESQS